MPGTAPLSLKQVDPVLRHASVLRMQRLTLVIAGISSQACLYFMLWLLYALA